MTKESRKQAKVTELAKKVYEHRYRYYVKDNPIISDFRFDFMYAKLGEVFGIVGLGEEPIQSEFTLQSPEHQAYNMVGFDDRHPWCDEIIRKVEKK